MVINLSSSSFAQSPISLILTVFGSATGGAAIAGFFSLTTAAGQRRHERQRELIEAKRLAYAQFVTAALGFTSFNGVVALAPESDAALRSAYGAVVLLGSLRVRAAADALWAEAWTEAGPGIVSRKVRDEFLDAARSDLYMKYFPESRDGLILPSNEVSQSS